LLSDTSPPTPLLLPSARLSIQDKKHQRQWYRLKNSKGSADSTKRGELELLIHWKYNKDIPRNSSVGRKASIMEMFSGRNSIDDEEASEDEDEDEDEKEKPKTEEEIEKERLEKEENENKLKEELGDIEIKSGDYQVQVHIIEVRDLKAEDDNGLSDPVVYVEAFGQKFNTKVIHKCLSAVYDERFIINIRDLDKEVFDAGQIKCTVMDADFGSRNDMIGAFVVDASRIYCSKGHEMYRKWVGLFDDTDLNDNGVQGYLKLSITIIGPGDKMKVHDEESDKKEEAEREAREGVTDVMMPPSIERETLYLVTTVYRAEYLPVMDQGTFSTHGIDAYFQVECGTAKMKTKVRHLEGDRSALNPEFNTELWIPVTVPIMSDIIKYTVWDKDRGPSGDSLVSTFSDKFNILNMDSDKSTPPRWRILMGAQVNGYNTLSNTIGKLGNTKDWKDHYNRFTDNAPHYRGRVLIKQKIVKVAPNKKDGTERGVECFRRAVKSIQPALTPPWKSFKVRAMIISGTEIPVFKNMTGNTRKMMVKIQCGKFEILTSRKENNNGVCEWSEVIETEEIRYPVDLDQIPDVVVSICKGKDAETVLPVAYKRFKFADLVNERFEGDTKWVMLEEDKVSSDAC